MSVHVSEKKRSSRSERQVIDLTHHHKQQTAAASDWRSKLIRVLEIINSAGASLLREPR